MVNLTDLNNVLNNFGSSGTGTVVGDTFGGPYWMNYPLSGGLIAVIAATGIAILRYRLYDIDRIIPFRHAGTALRASVGNNGGVPGKLRIIGYGEYVQCPRCINYGLEDLSAEVVPGHHGEQNRQWHFNLDREVRCQGSVRIEFELERFTANVNRCADIFPAMDAVTGRPDDLGHVGDDRIKTRAAERSGVTGS